MPAAARVLPPEPEETAGAFLPSHGQAANATRDRTYEVELVTSLAGFHALEADWNDLFERAGTDRHLFQTFNWLWHWANHFLPQNGGSGTSLAIVTARAGGRLAMVWPLVVERSGPIKELHWMGEPVSQYGDVLIEDGPSAAALMRAALDFLIAETGADVLRLRKVRADSLVAGLLAETGATVTNSLKAPYLDLASAPSFAEYEKRYSSGAKRNRKRQRRRLEERGAITLERLESGARAEALTARAFELKRAWLQHRGIVSPALADPRTARFFADATRADVRPAGCHVLALLCNDAPVALEIGVHCKGRSAIHIIAYDLDFEKTAAGALLMEDSIRESFKHGMKVFDLLAPGDGYKLEWADDAITVQDWAHPATLKGRIYTRIYLGLVRNGLKRVLDSLPVGARRMATDMLTRAMKRKSA